MGYNKTMLRLTALSCVINEKTILDDINFDFTAQKFYCITGKNGSGKSTLLRAIMGLHPVVGQLYFEGQDISNFTTEQRAQLGFSYAYQRPVQFRGISVADLFKFRGLEAGQAIKYLGLVGLHSSYLSRHFDKSLSGGEQKRIELALSLSRPSKVYLIDEPEAGIDLWSFTQLVQLFKELKQQSQAIFIVASHHRDILALSDHLLLMDAGKIQRSGNYADIMELSHASA